MKTIVARFTEMKNAPTDIIDVDGEEVSVNKVDKALKSVGVSLKNTNGQFRDLDDVFLDLAKKWDTLDIMQQRYVATTAAGSRQQSRFIAMMSNYKRTMELVGYANTSAGASQEQFGKTMESLESKLNRLHNAWEAFTTGIAKASTIKMAVDLLTALLTAINKITDATDPAHTGITKILVAILGFKAAKGIINSVLRNVGAQMATGMGINGDKAATTFYTRFKAKLTPLMAKNNLSKMTAGASVLKSEAASLNQLSSMYSNYGKTLAQLEQTKRGTAKYDNLLSMADAQRLEIKRSAIALGEEEIAQNLKNVTAEGAEATATDLSAKAKMKEKVATELETKAEIVNNNTSGIGFKQRALAILQVAFLGKEKRLAAMQTLGLVGAEEAEAIAATGAAGAQTTLNAALYSCPIGWIVAGIAALVGAFMILSAIIETDAEKQERLSTTAKNAAAALTEASNTLSEINESKNSLETLNKELEDLTAGTDEWKQKLIEVNAEVLKLIDKYPDLTKYVKDVNGQLTIEEAGWTEIYDRQFETVQKATSINAVASGLLAEQNYKMSNNRADRTDKGLEYSNYNAQAALSIVQDATSGTDSVNINKKNTDIISQALASSDIIANIDSIKASTSASAKDYATLMNLTEEEVNKKKENEELTDDQIKTALAVDKYQKQVKEQVQTLNSKLNTLNNKADNAAKKNIFTGLISKNGLGTNTMNTFLQTAHSNNILTGVKDVSELSAADKDEVVKGLKEYFKTIYNISEEELTQMGIDVRGLADYLVDDARIIYDTFEKTNQAGITDIAQQYITDLEGALDYDFDTKEVEAYANALASIHFQGGDIAAFQEKFKSLILSFKGNSEQISSFVTSLSGIDWTSGKSILSTLETFGASLDKNVRQELIRTTNASKDFSLVSEQEQANYTANANKIKTINAGSQKTFSYSKESDLETINFLKGLKTGDLKNSGINWSDYFVEDKDNDTFIIKDLTGLAKAELDLRQGAKNATEAQKNLAEAYQKSTQGAKEAKDIINKPWINKNTYNANTIGKKLFNGTFTYDGQQYVGFLSNEKDPNTGNYKLSSGFYNRANNGAESDKSYWTTAAWTNDQQSRNDKFAELLTNFVWRLNKSSEDTSISDFLLMLTDSKDAKEFGNKIKNENPDAGTAEWNPSHIADYLQVIAAFIQENPDAYKNISEEDYKFITDAIVAAANSESSYLISDNIKDYWLTGDKRGEYKLRDDRQQYYQEVNAKIDDLHTKGLLSDQNVEDLKGIKNIDEKVKKLTELVEQENKNNVDKAKKAKDTADKNKYTTAMSAREIVSSIPDNTIQEQSQAKVLDTIIKKHEDWKTQLKSIQKQYDITKNEAKKVLAVEYEQNAIVDNVLKLLTDNKDALSKNAKGTEVYNTAINQLTTQFKDLFGDKITNTWVETHLDDIKKLSEGGSEATKAMERLSSTSEAALTKIQIGIKDADKIKQITMETLQNISLDSDAYQALETAFGSVANYIEGRTDDITTDFDSISAALKQLDGSSASIEVKAQTRDAFAELIRVGMADALATDNVDKFTSLYQLALSSGFAVSGIGSLLNTSYVDGQRYDHFTPDAKKKAGNLDVADWVTDPKTGEIRKKTYAERLLSKYTTKKTITPNPLGTGQYYKQPTESKSKSKSEAKEWRNDWNLQYSLLKKVEGLERSRTLLQKQQSRLVKDELLNEKQITKNKEKQRKFLLQQISANNKLAQHTKQDLLNLNKNTKFGKAIWYDAKLGAIQTNDKLIRGMDKKTKGEFDNVKSEYEKLISQLQSSEDNIQNAVDAIRELTGSISKIDLHAQFESNINLIEHTLKLYEKALARLKQSNSNVTSKEFLTLFKKTSKQRVNEGEQYTRDYIAAGAQLNSLLNNKSYQKYYKYDWETGKLKKTNAYYSITDPDIKSKVDNFLSSIQEQTDIRREADEKREELYDQQYEAQKAIAEEANTWQKNVYEAVVQQREEEITRLETINNSIQDASSKLIDSMQKSIQKVRQDRKNQKTEEELSDMQAKLSYLQADTSGANEVEIKRLQKQLTEKQENYTDTLIDQKISELQDQNKEAAEQRKMQIEIAKAQLQYDKQNGLIWGEVRGLIAAGVLSNGHIDPKSSLYKLLAKWGNANSLSAYDQQEFWSNQNYGSVNNAVNNKVQNSDYLGQIDYITTDTAYQALQNQMVNSMKNAIVNIINKATPYKKYMKYNKDKNTLKQIKKFPNKETNKALYTQLKTQWDATWEQINAINGILAYFKVNSATGTAFTQTPDIARHKKGGLVDYTGLHWLDGTKSDPELVLNAKDTQNFLALKDILSGVMSNTSSIEPSGGDINCEIQINVDSISNDYDVDQIAARIEYNIMQSAKYRNVNNITTMR